MATVGGQWTGRQHESIQFKYSFWCRDSLDGYFKPLGHHSNPLILSESSPGHQIHWPNMSNDTLLNINTDFKTLLPNVENSFLWIITKRLDRFLNYKLLWTPEQIVHKFCTGCPQKMSPIGEDNLIKLGTYIQIRIQHAQISIGTKLDQVIFTYRIKNEVTMLNKSWGHFFGTPCRVEVFFVSKRLSLSPLFAPLTAHIGLS